MATVYLLTCRLCGHKWSHYRIESCRACGAEQVGYRKVEH